MMTFKPDDCLQCQNQGYYLAPVILDSYSRNFYEPYAIEEKPCDCFYGREYQIFLDRMNHPEYVNPFLTMTDDEILETLAESSANQRAVDKEFYL